MVQSNPSGPSGLNKFTAWAYAKYNIILTLTQGKYAERYIAGDDAPNVGARKAKIAWLRGLLRE